MNVRISDEDNTLAIDWYDESEQQQEGGVTHQTIITPQALESWKHVGYYHKELMSDLEEIVLWAEKYRKGIYED
jgi:hypothetical protein